MHATWDERVGFAHLASRVHNLRRIFLSLGLDDLAEGILDGGIVAFHKMVLDESHRECGFACKEGSVLGHTDSSSTTLQLTDRSATHDSHLALLDRSHGEVKLRELLELLELLKLLEFLESFESPKSEEDAC